MAHADFVHLRVHSAYSLLEGAITVTDLTALARDNAMPAVAVTDSGNLFGAMEFALTAREAGVQPIIGCQMAVTRRHGEKREGSSHAPNLPPDQLVLLVQDETGYGNLLKLVSRAFLDSDAHAEPQVSLDDLETFSDGLIALSGGPAGAVGRHLLEDRKAEAEETLKQLAAIYPGRLYVEIMRHGMEDETCTESAFIDLAIRLDLPLVATNEAFFSDAAMYQAHDALLCIAESRFLSEDDRRRLTPEHRFKSAAEMRALFADLPEAADNTMVVARRCVWFPQLRDPMLPSFPCPGGQSEEETLRVLAGAGLETRLETHVFTSDMDASDREREAKPYRQRLEYELDVINHMGFAGYFLIVADFIQWAKAQRIPVGPGRGSGAGSVVSWSLTITDLDPLRFGLLFERFLNPERVSMPDFDIDFCQDRRDEVIRYVQDKYGQDHVAQIITFGTLQARAALRDVGRVLQMPYGQVDRICKLVPNNPAEPMPLAKAIESEPQLAQARDEDTTVSRMMEFAIALEGLYRHASTHAAGVVIGDRALDELVPLYRDPRSHMPVTQFSMKYVEMAGLVKFDFLGLKTLTVLARAVEALHDQNITVDLSTIPFDDAPTYEILGRAETVGVFQLESSGMRDVLRGLKPDRFEDIIAVVALYRPGPMDNIPSYVSRKHGEEPPDYMDDRLEDILAETFGIIIYQEQVIQIAQVLSGYTLGGADLLRRAMGKKIQSEMDAQCKHFVEGAMARGVPEAKANRIFDQVNKFAGYGFNKSHAAAYALVAYQTAYLKANYPVAFLAASMTLDLGNTDKLNLFRQEIGRLGLTLLPPDINKSAPVFSVEFQDDNSQAIRYALAATRNVGEQAMCELVAEREANGPFRDLVDFARRLDPRVANKRQLEYLVWAGAFDCLEPNRARALAAVEPIMRFAAAVAQARDSSQESLFGEADGLSDQDLTLPEADDWTVTAKLGHEFEALGFFLSSHPLEIYAAYLDRQKVISSTRIPAHLVEHSGDSHVRLAGIVTSHKERTSAKGSRFAFLGLSDSSGVYEVTVFSEVLSASRHLLEVGTALILSAEARMEGETLRLTAGHIDALDKVAAKGLQAIRVHVDDAAAAASLEGVLASKKGGTGKVNVLVRLPGNSDGRPREAEITLAEGYALSPALCADLASLPGIAGVEEG